MDKEEYKKQLQDPLWIARSKGIKERDGNACRFCGAKDVVLNVHHLEYRPFCKAWEYDNDLLVTLCRKCHEKQHELGINVVKEKAIRCYDDGSHLLCSLKTTAAINLLYRMFNYLEYNTGMVYLTNARTNELLSNMRMSKNTLNKSIENLKSSYLIFGNDGDYMINPVAYWYGTSAPRLVLLFNREIQNKFNFTIDNNFDYKD